MNQHPQAPQHPHPTQAHHGPNPGAAYAVHAPQGYEFTEEQSRIIGSASTWSLVLAVISGLQCFVGLRNENYANVAIHGLTTLFLVIAGESLRKVVKTQGQDVPQLIKALGSFGHLLQIRLIVLVIAALVLGLVGVAALVKAAH